MSSDAESIRTRVLCAIEAIRTPGYHFPGYFLDIRWPEVAPGLSRMLMPDGPHLRDEAGDVDLLALCALADVAVGTGARAADRTSQRLSTIHLQLQFTGARMRGDIVAEARLLGNAQGTALQQRLASAVLLARDTAVAHVTGEFVALAAPPEVALGPLPWQRAHQACEVPADQATLSDAERDVLRLCDEQLAKGASGFLQRFWLGPERAPAGDALRIATGVHMGNRVNHVQGGLLVGIAAHSARRAAPAGMGLSNVSAWFVSPGRGRLNVRSELLHAGRATALVRSVIAGDGGQTVLEAVTQHVALAASQ